MKNVVELKVSCFEELHAALSRYQSDYRWMFRGHQDVSWKLVPKTGRNNFWLANEVTFFEAWKRRAVEYVSPLPASEWDWLAIAQHHGLPTRLLDWSANPLVACFFAVESAKQEDAIVYAFQPALKISLESGCFGNSKPYVAEFRPNAFVPRISRQGGRFTVHNPSDHDLEADNSHGLLKKIYLDKKYISQLMIDLDQYGINNASIFPDLDGLSRHLQWIAAQRDMRNALIRDTQD